MRARNRPVLHVVARRPVMTLDEALRRIETLLGGCVEWTARARFLPAAGSPDFARSAKASSFVASLELARQGRVELRQDGPFETLFVRAA